ncbi:MAG: hypothetical protein ACSLFD_10005 [Solirubrobacterales bacterium]
MTVQLSYDDSKWLQLPDSFPTEVGETQQVWEDRIIVGMREAWDQQMSREQELMARGGLQHGVERVQPDDSITLQFWPMTAPVNVVVHVMAGVLADGESIDAVPIESGTYVGAPVIAPFSTDLLGDGLEVRYLAAIESDQPLAFGGINYLFRNDNAYVMVVAEATLPLLVGLLLEPLRDVIRTIHVSDLANGSWQPATLDPKVLTSISVGESWTVDQAK